MRIGVLTFHRAYNCGALLQAWALQTALMHMGFCVELPNCNSVGEHGRWRASTKLRTGITGRIVSRLERILINALSVPFEDIMRYRYRRFRKLYINEVQCQSSNLAHRYDSVVVGSDQVWSAAHSLYDAPLFFAEDMMGSVRKIAYAASYGDKPLPTSELQRVIAAVNRFDAVSVRERIAKDQLVGVVDKDVSVVLDPTLLLGADEYERIAAPVLEPRPYLFLYTLTAEPFFIETAKILAKLLGVKCIITVCYQYGLVGGPKGITHSVSPDRLVSYIKNAKYVLAASFHGTALGVIFRKPFLSLRAQEDQFESRPANLLSLIGCANRLVTPKTTISEMEMLLTTPFPKCAIDKLMEAREESIAWLQNALS